MADSWVTLRHRDHGGEQQFSADSVPAWRARGWLPLDEEPPGFEPVAEPPDSPAPATSRRKSSEDK